jgi:hypothetical protein
MNDPRNKLNVAVSNAVSSTTNEVNLPSPQKVKQGRPILQGLDKLSAEAFNDFKELEKSNVKLKDMINISSFSSQEDQDTVRENILERRKLGKSAAKLINKIKRTNNPKFKKQLINCKNNLLKELEKIPLEGELEVQEKSPNSVGKPSYPFIVYHTRLEMNFEDSHAKFNKSEKQKGLQLTTISDFRRKLEESINKPQVGRKPNSEVYVNDKEMKKVKNRIFQIEENIEEKRKYGVNEAGRKRHAEQQLEKQYKIYEYLHQKSLKLEDQMSDQELSQRRSQRLKHDRQGLRRKIHDANRVEKRFLKRQIFELTVKIKEEEYRSNQLCATKVKKNTVEVKKETPVANLTSNLINIDDLLFDLNMEKTKVDERNKYITELIEKITEKKKAA